MLQATFLRLYEPRDKLAALSLRDRGSNDEAVAARPTLCDTTTKALGNDDKPVVAFP